MNVICTNSFTKMVANVMRMELSCTTEKHNVRIFILIPFLVDEFAISGNVFNEPIMNIFNYIILLIVQN